MREPMRNKLRRLLNNRDQMAWLKWLGILLLAVALAWTAYGAGEWYQSEAAQLNGNAPIGSVTLHDLVVMAEKGQAQGTLTIRPDTRAWFKGTLFSPPIDASWRVAHFKADVSNGRLAALQAHKVNVAGNIHVVGETDVPGRSQLVVASLLGTMGGWVHLAIFLGLGLFLFVYLKSMMGSMSIFKKRFQMVQPEFAVTRFSDVIGMEGPKQEISEIVDYLRDPERFSALGARAPKGVLLYGPPGNGKTLLAKAVAGEAGVAFFEQNASSFVQLYVGAGAMSVRELFDAARTSGRAVIFIDEIDAVAGRRDGGMGSHDERLQTLNALLAELDGFGDNSGIIVIAATNRLDSLDPAITRPGRFDRKVQISLPGTAARAEMLRWYLGKVKAGVVDVPRLASMSSGFSGADIAHWVNEAAVEAARSGQSSVDTHAFLGSRDRILVGPRNLGVVLSPEERRVTAYHEAGHAVARMAMGGKVDKVSILPRGGALGVTISVPEDRNLHNREHLEQELVVLCAGRAAEELFIGAVSNGAASDLQRASQLAYTGVETFGFGSSGVYVPQSERMAAIVEQEAAAWVNVAYQRAKAILAEEKSQMASMAERLMREDEITLPGDDPCGEPTPDVGQIIAC